MRPSTAFRRLAYVAKTGQWRTVCNQLAISTSHRLKYGDLLPEPCVAEPETYSAWGLREAAGVSYEQFEKFRGWGLIPEADSEGRWSSDVIDRLIKIRQASPRPLARRVLCLRANYFDFPVPAACIRAAMLEILPSIHAPVRKMRRVHTANVKLAAAISRSAVRPRRQPLPAPSTWRSLLADSQPHVFDTLLTGLYHMPPLLATYGIALVGVPLEEHIALLMLLRLHERATGHSKYGVGMIR